MKQTTRLLQQLVTLEGDRAQHQEQFMSRETDRAQHLVQFMDHILLRFNAFEKQQNTMISSIDSIKKHNHEMMKTQSRRSDQLPLTVHRPQMYAPRIDQPLVPGNPQYGQSVRPDQSSTQGSGQ
jgi:hypothetical protein